MTVKIVSNKKDIFQKIGITGKKIENSLKEGNRFGVFSVKKIGSNSIELDNDIAIDLDPGSCINLLGDLAFVAADSDELRFYPTNDGGSGNTNVSYDKFNKNNTNKVMKGE